MKISPKIPGHIFKSGVELVVNDRTTIQIVGSQLPMH